MDESTLKFCDGVRHLYIPELNKISSCTGSGLRQWLAVSDSYLPGNSSGDGYFEIILYDMREVLSVFAHDIDRLSCAAIETVTNISPAIRNKKFVAWNLVNYYYSAFYSAHSLLKILGFGLVQIDDRIIRHLRARCLAVGVAETQITSGIYCIEFDFSCSTVKFYKVRRYNDSHKGLWQRFFDFLNVLIGVSVVSGSYDANCIRIRNPGEPYPMSLYSKLPVTDADAIVSKVDSLKQILNRNGDNNWLSFIRNSINYSHSFGVWYPYKSYSVDHDHLLSMSDLWKKDLLSYDFDTSSEKELGIFVKSCQMINALNFDVLMDLCARHPENKSFLKNGTMSYIKHFCT